ncbi:hypothetical protein FKW77_010846 [Venturia effusa]|uniref:Uncharacterized protein n=1 Tax=Venturia effusa TaxID=50376 RepID=A0A517KYL7_9PEZI|nr:hypothetical protein FKW77_010846 [Venturia effusa]
MVYPNFGQPPSNGKHGAKAERIRKDEQVVQLLQQICGHAADAETATSGLDMSEVMQNQVEFPNDGQELRCGRLQILAEFLFAETALSRAMLAFSKDIHRATENSDEESLDQAVKEKAIREFLAENTHEASQALELVAMVDSELSVWAVTVFSSFFEIQPNPNLAEIEFLARTTESSSAVVATWFTSKRNRLLNLFKSKKLLGDLNDEEAERMLVAVVKEKAAKEGKAL